jgi:trehalose 6-phosphate synthase
VADVAGGVVVVSNRGPVSYDYDEAGELVSKRGGGGVASSLAPLLRGTGTYWLASAMSDADREAASSHAVDAEDLLVRYLAIPPDVYRMAYDVISNGTLWFLYHGLFDLPRRPRLDDRWWRAWEGYRAMNRAFARTVVDEAPQGATVLVQDYHLSLVGTWLAQERPDLRAVHFSHVPFCSPEALRVLPTSVAEELLGGMASHRACGFHARRWAAAFEACCEEVLGCTPPTFVSPLAPDQAEIEQLSSSDECNAHVEDIEALLEGRPLILRVDRIELSKNLLRGFHAFDHLLQVRKEWRGRVVFGAFVYPSRESLPEYLAYRQEVESLARYLNDRWSTPGWTPILLDTSDDFTRSLAALRRYDVLLVNPVRDGLNLVAKEGPMVNERDGVLLLSREAGVAEELGDSALEVNPFDVVGTADSLALALSMGQDERANRSAALRKTASERSPRDWLDDQLAAAGS